MIKYIFPYEKIKKDSRIIIYGLGVVGCSYVEQIHNTKYCSIQYIIDNAKGKSSRIYTGIPVYTLDEAPLEKTEFDTILVAVSNIDMQESIDRSLAELKIDKTKIIFGGIKWSCQGSLPPFKLSEKAQVCVYLAGGMGDYIISRKFVESLIQEESDLEITLIGDLKLVDAFYCDISQLKKRIQNLTVDINIFEKTFDAVLELQHTANILYCDLMSLQQKSKKLDRIFRLFIENKGKIEVNASLQQTIDCVNLKRAKYLGLNRYTMFSHYGILNIDSQKVTIPLKQEYERVFLNLDLPKIYVTIGYGSSLKNGGENQTKVWPKNYYEEFLKDFKNKYGQISVIQLGESWSNKVKGCDAYILGQNIETIKYVLKYAFLHIDCEGGLVHLATQLGTKCIVLFGPTPSYYYGYDCNINIKSTECGECMGCTKNWFTQCIKGDNIPARCMRSITPGMVLKKVDEYLGFRLQHLDDR